MKVAFEELLPIRVALGKIYKAAYYFFEVY